MTELRVPKNQAETLLQQQIERGRALAADGLESRSEADYDDWILAKERWKSFSSAALARIYGDESGEKKEFDNSGRVLMVVGGTPWTVEQQRAVERVRSSANVLVSLVERLEIAEEPFTVNPPVATKEAVSDEARKPQGVFVVHGRDEAARESVARVLERAGREVVILHEQANRGRTLIEKFEQHATEAGFAVILLTGDDVGGLSAADLHSRARQNVVFEMGFFYGLLGRDRVAVLLEPGVEKPSDIDGLVYIELDPAGAWKTALLNEL